MKRRGNPSGIGPGMVLVLLLLGATPALGHYLTGSENVSGTRMTPEYMDGGKTYGPFEWDYSYTRSFDGTKLTKHLEIQFLFDENLGYDATQQAAYKATAETNIENIWNNKFKIRDTANNTEFPITVDVTTTGPFNQTVTIHKWDKPTEAAPWNLSNWYVGDPYPVDSGQAHEFGHMLGLYDEYIGGAVNQYPDPLLSNDGLMGYGALNANPVMYSRYYQQYLDYMNSLNGDHTFELVMVPEPGCMLLAGLALFLLAQRRFRKAARA